MDSSGENTKTSAYKYASGIIKGVKSFNFLQGYKYSINLGASKSCVVSIVDTTLTKGRKWVVRFDKPHGLRTPFNHVNVNPTLSGLAKDPHLKLPPGGLKVAEETAKSLKFLNRVSDVLFFGAVAVDATVVGHAAYKDYQNGTSENTVKAVTQAAGGWTGGFAGGFLGATVGTLILPVIGTTIFGLAGAIAGGVGGAVAASSARKIVWPLEEDNNRIKTE